MWPDSHPSGDQGRRDVDLRGETLRELEIGEGQ
jgi:hypothetical protein